MRCNKENLETVSILQTSGEWKPSNSDNDIAVLISGGVDSSTTAMLLKNAGWNVLGITMKLPMAENCDARRSCCGIEAAYVCQVLNIPHFYIDVRDAFKKLVIEPFRQAYINGRTPSPCVDCNTVFKFGIVWDIIERSFGVSNVATGHYARIIREDSNAYLARAKDLSKDQSYFLYGIPRERLSNLYLPLGEYSKDEVREIAKNAQLPVARRQESMELCFVGEANYRNALAGLEKPGLIKDIEGNVIGEHNGIFGFTIGQRKGIRIPARKPLYVVDIKPDENVVVVGNQDDLMKRHVRAESPNILIANELLSGACLYGKIRSQGDPVPCVVKSCDTDNIEVQFDSPQFAPTPGQRLVLYNKSGRVVAGGVIFK